MIHFNPNSTFVVQVFFRGLALEQYSSPAGGALDMRLGSKGDLGVYGLLHRSRNSVNSRVHQAQHISAM